MLVLLFASAFFAANGEEVGTMKPGDGRLFKTFPENKEFLVDKEWKTKTFSLYGKELKDTWGFVSDSYLPLDLKGYDELLQCQDNWDVDVTMAEWGKMSTVNYYPTTQRFRDYEGIDMVPENKDSYIRGTAYATKLDFESKSKYQEGPVRMKTCKIEKSAKGGSWSVQRVGPFTSTGGYDWWQLGFSNAGNLKAILAEHPDGVDILDTILIPVLADGTRMGHPPVHIHHIHFVAQQGVRPRNLFAGLCVSTSTATATFNMDTVFKEKNCYNSSLILEQHGDYQCKVEEDGIECLTAGDHNIRRLNQVMDLEGELNDVRPFNSPPMEWYYQVALRWAPVSKANDNDIISQMTMMAPGNAVPSDQLTRVLTFPTPTKADTFIWYTGHQWANGEMVRNKLHAHNMVFESSGFFVGSPEDLGLTKEFWPKKAFVPLFTKEDLGYETNDALAAVVFANLDKAQKKYDRLCVEEIEPSNSVCKFPRPRFLCGAIYDAEYFVDGIEVSYDRRPKTFCDPWEFKKGDPFTVIGFSRTLKRPTLAAYPTKIPEFVPGHVSWHFWYKHHGWSNSFFGRIVCNQEGIWFDAAIQTGITTTAALIATVIAGGGVPTTNTLVWSIKFLFLGIIWTIILSLVYVFALKPKKD